MWEHLGCPAGGVSGPWQKPPSSPLLLSVLVCLQLSTPVAPSSEGRVVLCFCGPLLWE